MGNKGYEGVWEVWEGDNWSDGYGKYRDRRGTGSIGKGPKHSTTHIYLSENHPHHRPGINLPSLPTRHPSTQRHQAVPRPPQASHHKRKVPLALEVELTYFAVSYRTTRQVLGRPVCDRGAIPRK